MITKSSVSDWETLVKKQLKTEDFTAVLAKNNLENIEVKPYYSVASQAIVPLPKCEENTQLVAKLSDHISDDIFAYLSDSEEKIPFAQDKTFFIKNKIQAQKFIGNENNRFFSLIDVFDEESGTLDVNAAKKLLQKPFERSLAIDIAFHQNSGASIIQQLGIALAKTKELVEVFGPEIFSKIIFKMAVGANYFFEISKIRALKLLINQFSKEYGLDEIPYIFAETSQRNKSKTDEENNLIRSTLELAAAMIGGADAVYSENYKISAPTLLSDEISFKQQIVLAYESIINVFEDAASGSFFIEDITRQFAEKSWQYFLKIEDNGGYLESLNVGRIQQEIYQQAVAEQRWVEEGQIKLIGVNLYPKLDKTKNSEELYKPQIIKEVRWAEMFES